MQLDAVSSCDRLIGSSPQIRQVYDLVRRVARSTPPCWSPVKAAPAKN